MKRIAHIFTLTTIIVLPIFAQPVPEFEVCLEKKKVKAGEPFKYTIKVELKGDNLPEIKLPEFDKIDVASQSKTQSIRFQSGAKTIVIDLRYLLSIPEEGEYDLPVLSLQYEDDEITSPVEKISVSGKAIDKELHPSTIKPPFSGDAKSI